MNDAASHACDAAGRKRSPALEDIAVFVPDQAQEKMGQGKKTLA
jgi:hypothetical protein